MFLLKPSISLVICWFLFVLVWVFDVYLFYVLPLVIDNKSNADSEKQLKEMRLTNLVIENSPVVVFLWKATEGWPVEYVSNNVTQFGYTVGSRFFVW